MTRSKKRDNTKYCGATSRPIAAAGVTWYNSCREWLAISTKHWHTQLPSMPIGFYIKLKCIDGATEDKSQNIQLPQTGNNPDVHYRKTAKWQYNMEWIFDKGNEYIIFTGKHLNEYQKHNDEWKKSNPEQYKLYDFMYRRHRNRYNRSLMLEVSLMRGCLRQQNKQLSISGLWVWVPRMTKNN